MLVVSQSAVICNYIYKKTQMKILYRILFSLLSLYSQKLNSQNEMLALAKPEYDNLLVNVDNVVYVIGQQNKPIRLNQITAEYSFNHRHLQVSENKGQFIIRPDSAGVIMISIRLNGKVVKQYLRAIEIRATPYLSLHRTHDKMSSGEMSVQRCLTPVVENYGFNIRCQILSFELTKINTMNSAYKSKNEGETFIGDTKLIIESASPGDIYFFYNIICKCPGNNFPHRLDDFLIEIEK